MNANTNTLEHKPITDDEKTTLADILYKELPKGQDVERKNAIACAQGVLDILGYVNVNACHIVLHMEKEYDIPRKGNVYQL